jgi:excisionase family DNA binding protein
LIKTELISIGNVAELLGVSIDTLRRWDKARRLQSVRSGPRGHRYYRQDDIKMFLRDEETLANQWAEAPEAVEPASDVYCQTRDNFQARLETLKSKLSRTVSLSTMSLITAIAGEIGNNSFDHNIGNWPDIPGVYFAYNLRNRTIVLADRGQGILTTLKRVKPDLYSATEALKVAFTERISGRQPEARGNGLKFVREVIINNPFRLRFQTGNAILQLKRNDKEVIVKNAEKIIKGCFATIVFEDIV